MANADDFGITASLLNPIINPAKSAYSYWIGPATTGSNATGGASGLFTDSAASLAPSAYVDFKMKVGNSYYTITANTATTVTTDGGNLSGTNGAYQITAEKSIATADAALIVARVVSTVKSALPEKYRRMLARIEGENIVERAYHNQTSATTAFKVRTADTLHLWRNYEGSFAQRTLGGALLSPLDVSSGNASTADYSVGTASTTTITFKLGGNVSQGLSKGDSIVADYYHDLIPVPKILQNIALHLSAYEIMWQNSMGAADIDQFILEHRDWANATLEAIQTGKSGVTEFDEIRMYEETRQPATSGWATFAKGRG